jgi:hypothetical protein
MLPAAPPGVVAGPESGDGGAAFEAFLDPVLRADPAFPSLRDRVRRVAAMAFVCVDPRPASRPNAARVHTALRAITTDLPASLLRVSADGADADAAPASADSDAGLCVLCLDQPAVVAMSPCGHVCLCENDHEMYLETARRRAALKCPVNNCDATRAVVVLCARK